MQGRRQVKICGVDRHGERGARAYNGGLEAEPTGPTPPPPFSPVKTRRICINFRSDLSTPVHPLATPLDACQQTGKDTTTRQNMTETQPKRALYPILY